MQIFIQFACIYAYNMALYNSIMKATNIGAELAHLRKGKISQGDLAAKMGVDQSSVSRMEADPNPARGDVDKYLAALDGDPAAKEFREYLDSKWPHVGKPAFRHPYLDELGKAEAAIAKLRKFIADPATPADLGQQAKLYEDGLREVAAYLLDLKHVFAFLGNIMVGKTTALCFITDLLIEEGKTLKQRVPLDTGAGWTTLCEVQLGTLDSGLEESGKFGIVVYPHTQDEVFRLASDVCTSLMAMRDGKESESRVPEEIEKVLRAMAELPRRPVKGPDGGLEDPLLDLARTCDTSEQLTAEFKSRMKLDERATTDIWFNAPTLQEGLAWLQAEFRKINGGRNTKVSLPKRIDVFVPVPLLKDTPYDPKFVDTKGSDETAIRPDLQAYLDDPRTVTILCSRFAPDANMIDVLSHLTATGKTGAISDRIIFLVLARQDEALAINSEDGNPIEDPKEAYALREAQIRSKLAKFPGGKDVPIMFYDCVEEDSAPIRDRLLRKLNALCVGQATRLKEITSATDDLVTKYQEQQVQTAMAKLRAKLQQFVDTYHQLPDRIITVHSRLLDAFNRRHARTVWASTRRNGEWDNLNSYQIAGVSANMDAQARCNAAAAALDATFDGLMKDPVCAAIQNHLLVLKKNVADWKLKFLDKVRRRSEEIFRAVLFPDNLLWDTCEAYWPQGKGFRDRVAGDVRKWLDDPRHEWLQEAIEGIIRKEWQDFFISPIQAQCKADSAPAP
jgi:transcriptional regulator with XRE-family HTH domain